MKGDNYIMANEKVLHLTTENFEQEINSGVPVLVDFWASWCGPCRMIAPVIDELANEFQNTAKIAKVNVDEQRELAIKYNVMSIPTIIIFKNGAKVNTTVGVKSKQELVELINKYI